MGRKEQGGPDIWNVSYPACTPFLPWPRPAAPHHSILWGCPERMPQGNEQQTLPWEAAFMPPLPPAAPPISLPREPFLARHVQILCLLTVRPSSGVSPSLVWERGSFSRIGTPFDGQLYLLWNERGTEQCSPCLLPLHAVSLEARSWPAGLSTRLWLRGLYRLGALA